MTSFDGVQCLEGFLYDTLRLNLVKRTSRAQQEAVQVSLTLDFIHKSFNQDQGNFPGGRISWNWPGVYFVLTVQDLWASCLKNWFIVHTERTPFHFSYIPTPQSDLISQKLPAAANEPTCAFFCAWQHIRVARQVLKQVVFIRDARISRVYHHRNINLCNVGENCLNCSKLQWVYRTFTLCMRIYLANQMDGYFRLRLVTSSFKHMQVGVQSKKFRWLKERKCF